jgi:hypothetical protein
MFNFPYLKTTIGSHRKSIRRISHPREKAYTQRDQNKSSAPKKTCVERNREPFPAPKKIYAERDQKEFSRTKEDLR